jgi:hypothetical protein
LPETGTASTIVPPLPQEFGGEAWGPKATNVIVPPAPAAACESVALIELLVIGLSTAPVAGAAALNWVGTGLTNISDIPDPQGVLDGALLASPL